MAMIDAWLETEFYRAKASQKLLSFNCSVVRNWIMQRLLLLRIYSDFRKFLCDSNQ